MFACSPLGPGGGGGVGGVHLHPKRMASLLWAGLPRRHRQAFSPTLAGVPRWAIACLLNISRAATRIAIPGNTKYPIPLASAFQSRMLFPVLPGPSSGPSNILCFFFSTFRCKNAHRAHVLIAPSTRKAAVPAIPQKRSLEQEAQDSKP